ncbi:RNA polymerase B [Rhizophlyctis rosea]|uniref:RNA polymerase B n=1 Tax=Rhizophlyctis rosea TaxID=64517 RepID=A0AAD5X6F2_9FUNG|nr:RNA polymerase B [Rhizophlyctis rosea]
MAYAAKRGGADDTDATALQFGPAFDKATALIISEVKDLIQIRVDSPLAPQPARRENIEKILEYCSKFDHYPGPNDSAEARRYVSHSIRPLSSSAFLSIVNRKEPYEDKLIFHPFEMAQLGNLCPDSVEEAKSLVPSLNKYDDDVIDEVLKDLSALRSSHF